MPIIIVAYILVIISRIVFVYGNVQENRDPIDRPLIWGGDVARTLLLLIALGLFSFSLYLAYSIAGVNQVILIILLFFIVLPFLDTFIKKLMNRLGI